MSNEDKHQTPGFLCFQNISEGAPSHRRGTILRKAKVEEKNAAATPAAGRVS